MNFFKTIVDLEEDLQFLEASYPGNIGMMEMFKFHEVATPEQKKELKDLISTKQVQKAWEFLQKVIGVKLHDFQKNKQKVILILELTIMAAIQTISDIFNEVPGLKQDFKQDW